MRGGTCHTLCLRQKDAQQTKQHGSQGSGWGVRQWAETAGFPYWSEKDREKRKDPGYAGLKDVYVSVYLTEDRVAKNSASQI